MPKNTAGKVYALSHAPESAYGTAVAAATGAGKAHQQIVGQKSDAPVNIEVRTQDNKEFATGSNFATRQYTTEHDARHAFNIELDSYILGLLLHSALGAVTSSAPIVGLAAVKRHVFKPYDPKVTVQLPPRTLLEYLASGEDRVFPGQVVESFELKGEGAKTIMASASLIGSGKVVKPSGHNVDWTDTDNVTVIKASGRSFFENTQARITLSDASTLANPEAIGCQLRNWSFGIQNQLLADLGYMPNCGTYQDNSKPENGIIRSRLLVSSQTVAPKFEIEVGSTDVLQQLIDQKPLDFNLTLNTTKLIGNTGGTDYFHKAIIRCFLTAYKTVARSTPDNILVAAIEPTVLEDASGNTITVTLDNTTTSYTA